MPGLGTVSKQPGLSGPGVAPTFSICGVRFLFMMGSPGESSATDFQSWAAWQAPLLPLLATPSLCPSSEVKRQLHHIVLLTDLAVLAMPWDGHPPGAGQQ